MRGKTNTCLTFSSSVLPLILYNRDKSVSKANVLTDVINIACAG